MKKRVLEIFIFTLFLMILSCSKVQLNNFIFPICPKEGEWETHEKDLSFTIKDCKVTDYVLHIFSDYHNFYSGPNIIIPINHSSFNYEVYLNEGGKYTISGLFISPISAQGTWTWKDQTKDWTASPKAN